MIIIQTFLPFANFKETARVLDNKRLGKQRVECLQIMRTLRDPENVGWKHHPAVLMWKGYEGALIVYSMFIINEWTRRGYEDTCFDKILEYRQDGDYELVPLVLDPSKVSKDTPVLSIHAKWPHWLGDERLHASHRANLLRKNPVFYGHYGWTESPDKPYHWPVRWNVEVPV